MRIGVIILSILCVITPLVFCANNIHPVIFIPGDGGCQIDAKLNKTSIVHYMCQKTTSDYFNIWLNIELLVPYIIDCWVDNIKLVYNNVSRTTSNSPGVETRVPGFGSSETVEWIDPSHNSAGSYFKDVANTLVSGGYVRNISIRGAPYDFRKAPNENKEYFIRLKQLVEETYTMNNNRSVVLLVHSMGGPMSLHFLHLQSQSWKDKYIRCLVSLSGAWGGSVKAIKVYAIGDDLGSLLLRQSILREEQITSPSLAWLLPSTLFWKEDEVFVETDKKNYTFKNLKDFFYDIRYPDGWEMRKDTIKYTLDFSPPNVEVHCLYGVGVDTVERLHYKPGTWLDGQPVLINGDGDGTVNLRSLEGCLHWQNMQKQKVYSLKLPKVDHMSILNNEHALDYIAQLIKKL